MRRSSRAEQRQAWHVRACFADAAMLAAHCQRTTQLPPSVTTDLPEFCLRLGGQPHQTNYARCLSFQLLSDRNLVPPAADVEAKFNKSAWGQKLAKRSAKAAQTDFDRYKVGRALVIWAACWALNRRRTRLQQRCAGGGAARPAPAFPVKVCRWHLSLCQPSCGQAAPAASLGMRVRARRGAHDDPPPPPPPPPPAPRLQSAVTKMKRSAQVRRAFNALKKSSK